MEVIGFIWNEVFLRPMLNSVVLLYIGLFHNLGLAIIVFTILIRFLIMPLTLRQIRQMKAMAQVQPKLKQLQEKHGKDRQRLSQETLRLYRQAGVNPIGCLGPLVIQFPIWIGLFQALVQTLPNTPDAMVNLARKLYFWLPGVEGAIPLNSNFLWMDLAAPDPLRIVMPLLVGVTTWVQQKMSTMPAADPRQASTNNMLLWMMPVMLAFFSMTFPSGLALYWIVSNVVGVLIQAAFTGWKPLFAKSVAASASVPAPAASADENRPVQQQRAVEAPQARVQQTQQEVREVSGRTVDQAMDTALKEMNARHDEVQIEVIERGRPGFLGFGGEPARIRVRRTVVSNLAGTAEKTDSQHLKEADAHGGTARGVGKDRRRGNRARPQGDGGEARRGGDRGSKQR